MTTLLFYRDLITECLWDVNSQTYTLIDGLYESVTYKQFITILSKGR